MSTPHNAANVGDIAKTVLMPGDPLRAKFIAENFLENAVQFNSVRNMFGYTGTYKGKRISVMGSGMGMPSMGIYSHELYGYYDVDRIIRIGTCGGISDDVKVRDVLVALGASTDSNFQNAYDLDGTYAAICDYDLLKAADKASERSGIYFKAGNILSSDHFYYFDNHRDFNANWKKLGVMAVEMETHALYCVAAALHKQALGIFTVSDHLYTGESVDAESREKTFTDMMKLALETAIQFED